MTLIPWQTSFAQKNKIFWVRNWEFVDILVQERINQWSETRYCHLSPLPGDEVSVYTPRNFQDKYKSRQVTNVLLLDPWGQASQPGTDSPLGAFAWLRVMHKEDKPITNPTIFQQTKFKKKPLQTGRHTHAPCTQTPLFGQKALIAWLQRVPWSVCCETRFERGNKECRVKVYCSVHGFELCLSPVSRMVSFQSSDWAKLFWALNFSAKLNSQLII